MTSPIHFPERQLGDHRARWLATVNEAYAEMERCIEGASTSVRLETYLLRDTGPAIWLRAALLRARARNVQVWMLMDAFGSEGVSEAFLAPLREAGVRLAVFNPMRLLRLTFRNHRKLLVVDDVTAVVGGFNIGPEYVGDGVARGWCDTGLVIHGPIAATLARSFDAMYALAPFHARAIRGFRPQARAPEVAGAAVQLLQLGPGVPLQTLREALRDDLRNARDVVIASAYFLPSLPIRQLLYQVVRRGGRLRVLLAGQSDVPLARYAGERLYRRLFRRMIRIHEYQPQILHAKLVVMDDVVYVGSCNLDRRSLHINHELLLRLHWPELAGDARRWFEAALSHAPAVDPVQWRSGRTLWQRLRSRFAYLLLARLDPLLARRRFRAIS